MSRTLFKRLISALLAVVLVFEMSAINAPVRSYAEEGGPSFPEFLEPGESFSGYSGGSVITPESSLYVGYFNSLKGCNSVLDKTSTELYEIIPFSSGYPELLGSQQVLYGETFDAYDVGDYILYGWKYVGYVHYAAQSFVALYVAQYRSVISYDIYGDEKNIKLDEVIYYFDENGNVKNSSYTIKTPEELGVSREGYEFVGWSDPYNETFTPGMTIDVEDMNLSLRGDWIGKSKVSYSPGEGNGKEIIDYVGSDGTYKLRSEVDFTRDGYILSGWKDSEGTIYELGTQYISDFGDMVLTAVWTEKTKITYSPGEGKGEVITDHVDSDQTYNLRDKADFTRDGYDLTGWKDSKGKQYELGASYDHSLGDLELTAVWTEKIKITYAPGEGKGTAVTDTVAFDETYSLRDKADFTRDGYKLSGWKDKAGNEYALGASYDLKKGSIELTAMWEASVKTGKAKITYSPGDGSGTAITDEVNFKYVSESKAEDYNLRKTADFTRKGYKLIGWKAADGTEYALGASYDLAKGDLSLMAVWEEVKSGETERKKGTLTISVNKPVYLGTKIVIDTKSNSGGKVTLEYK